MKIPGTEPEVLQQIKNQTTKPTVRETQKAAISKDKKQDKNSQNFQQQLGRSVKKLNEAVELLESSLRFETAERDGRQYVRIIDSSSNKLLREVPPEKVLGTVEKMQKMLGLLVDELI